MLPPSERPAARPAQRRADTPRTPRGSAPLTDPYGIPAISDAPLAPRHAARKAEPFAAPPLPEVVAAAVVAPPTPDVEPAETPAPAQAKAPDPVVREPKVREPKVREPKVREPKVREPKVREPRTRPKPAPARLRRRADPTPEPEVVVEPEETLVVPVEVPAAPAPPAAPPVVPAVTRAPLPNPAAARVRTEKPVLTPEPATVPLPRQREWWVIAVLLGAAAVATVRIISGPDVLEHLGAAAISIGLSWGLAIRTGGRPFWAVGLGSALALGAVITDWAPLTSGAAVATGVLAAAMAIMVTTPAATVALAVREVVIATGVAWIGALGVVGYGPGENSELDVDRFEYVVLGLALVGAFALVYRLGAGLHGLGRRGYVVAGGALFMLVLALAYSEAIAQWGSRDIVSTGDDIRDWMKSSLGAVPHPIVALLGYPALVWGVFMRARRRQGWWVCAFGVAATAPTTTRLIATDVDFQSIALGGLYSFVIGMALGYLVIRVEQSFTGSHGRRARRDEEAVAHRPEPRRTLPLH